MLYPDEDLPELQLSLHQYVDMATGLLQHPSDIFDYCRMVLAGRAKVEGVEHRIFVNARQDLPNIEPEDWVRTRDYDSLCGCTSDLPFSHHLGVFAVAPFKETLTKSNHLTAKAYDRQASARPIVYLLFI